MKPRAAAKPPTRAEVFAAIGALRQRLAVRREKHRLNRSAGRVKPPADRTRRPLTPTLLADLDLAMSLIDHLAAELAAATAADHPGTRA